LLKQDNFIKKNNNLTIVIII